MSDTCKRNLSITITSGLIWQFGESAGIVPAQTYTNKKRRGGKKTRAECSVLQLLGNRLKVTFWIIPKLGGNQKR